MSQTPSSYPSRFSFIFIYSITITKYLLCIRHWTRPWRFYSEQATQVSAMWKFFYTECISCELQSILFNIFIDAVKEQIHCIFLQLYRRYHKDKGEWKIILRFSFLNVKNTWEGMIRRRRDTLPC